VVFLRINRFLANIGWEQEKSSFSINSENLLDYSSIVSVISNHMTNKLFESINLKPRFSLKEHWIQAFAPIITYGILFT